MVVLQQPQFDEPRQFIPKQLARGTAARALRMVPVVKCILLCWYDE